MDFTTLTLFSVYDTSSGNLGEDFFSPVLSKATHYDRGVGFFSSGWLKNNAFGMTRFAENGGKARWITSPILDKRDWEAMKLGVQAQEDVLTKIMLESWKKDISQQLTQETLTALAWLIFDGIINFKIAVPRNKLCGEFHDKFGIFIDKYDNKIAFSGSYNDTIQGELNYESIKVFTSWTSSVTEYIELEEKRFENLWNDDDRNVQVFTLPEAIKNQIAKCRSISRPYKTPDCEITKGLISIKSFIEPKQPTSFELRKYQNEAIEAWKQNGFIGIFEMATGTGKTFTSLSASLEVLKLDKRIALIICCPFTHLVEQWDQNARAFQYRPILAYQNKDSWLNELNNQIISYNSGYQNELCCITTNTTFISEDFLETLDRINSPITIIADEAHYFGADQFRRKIPQHITYRLGLTATPTRWFDNEGTEFLYSYFDKVVFTYDLEDAITHGYLTHYEYYPILVDLTGEELADYSDLTKQIIKLMGKAEKDQEAKERLNLLLIKRSNILKNATNKFEKLEQILKESGKIEHTIFYCSPQQRGELLLLLGKKLNIRTHQFTYEEGNKDRHVILEKFASGRLHAVVAMKCLDEGVDVPSTRSAFFLANSTNPKEFIQRRGRVLRNSPGKEKAYLYDFIVVPPLSNNETEINLSRSIFLKELARFKEFVGQSDNYFSAHHVIWEIAHSMGINEF
ncbi:MAG: DEAD/DEAH box helicase family protein [Anaerolineaceae bacterium]|nr:DEAD/DEAH box helicase family protein [Anaerolineaceae bacterium]